MCPRYKVLIKLIVGNLLISCMTLEAEKPEEDDLEPTHYTLRLGEPVINQNPLPTYTPIMVDWHYKNGAIKSNIGFKGWDFNKDGRLDMVEVVGNDGSIEKYVFDFDFDGEIDMEELRK